MSFVLWFLGLLVCPVVALWFVIYPRLITDAHWYGWISERLYLYCFPTFFAAGAVVSAQKVFDMWGTPWPEEFAQPVLAIAGFLALYGAFSVFGLPVPPFLTPKWVRERRKQDREERRRRRREKKAAASPSEQIS